MNANAAWMAGFAINIALLALVGVVLVKVYSKLKRRGQ